MTQAEVRDACSIILAARDGAAHPVVATVVVATGPGAHERVQREIQHWGRSAGDDVGVGGTAEAIAQSLRELRDAGVTSVAIHPTRDEPDLQELLDVIAGDVRALLR